MFDDHPQESIKWQPWAWQSACGRFYISPGERDGVIDRYWLNDNTTNRQAHFATIDEAKCEAVLRMSNPKAKQ